MSANMIKVFLPPLAGQATTQSQTSHEALALPALRQVLENWPGRKAICGTLPVALQPPYLKIWLATPGDLDRLESYLVGLKYRVQRQR